ncbi:MAG: InlB B-repeat-containing protein, partial [Candidatus Methanoplasma sp.]|nr:InlB B-repeat-containing protein [Candidatus Methanoplasma sp.]
FKEWTVVSGGVDVSGNEFTIGTSDVVIAAVWENITYTVTLNDGAGSGGQGTVQVTFDEMFPSVAVPEYTGYDFGGYFGNSDGNGKQYTDSDGNGVSTWDIDSNATLYAKWTEKTYAVVYNPNNGSENLVLVSGLTSGTLQSLNEFRPPGTPEGRTDMIFIGWTLSADSKVYTKDDDAAGPDTVTAVTIAYSDVTVYAAWGLDTNNNGTADIYEEEYTLTYDMNGGTGPGIIKSGLLADEHTLDAMTLAHGPIGETGVVFIGWTEERDTKIYGKDDDIPPETIGKVTITDNDVTIYAVWGYDENGDGIPDVLEYTLTYDVNGGNFDGPDSILLPKQNGYQISEEGPTHSPVDGSEVLFIGWMPVDRDGIFSKGDPAPVIITSVDMTADATVYAAWGYDKNGDGIPDVMEAEDVDASYMITSSSDSGSNITPNGMTQIISRGSQTYMFSAKPGNTISSVLVDGTPLTPEQVESGTYTFRNVLSNHSIEVITGEPAVLDITVGYGIGEIWYSINGSPFTEYVSPVTLPHHADVSVTAYAGDGYEFRNWWNDGITYDQETISFNDVMTPLYLEVYFYDEQYGQISNGNTLWLIIGAMILVAAMPFTLYAVLHRHSRKYE